ncbi:HD domain-containing phosphohydrolase [Pectinatus frisingensis]|uniref:HD domain-containing phosphohydrolase n=1 Tax=Pectinatus frisingensis TaxID=865 RepID=UPI0018C6A74A|nr:HD domain-containing phosphohydrolase [Pectinatus frisingensis]
MINQAIGSVLQSEFNKIKKRNEILETLKKRVDIIFNGTHDGMGLIIFDKTSNIFRYLLVNKAFCNFLNIGIESIINKTPLEIFGISGGNQIIDSYFKCLKEKHTIEIEEVLYINNKKTYFQTKLTPVYEENDMFIIVSKKNVTKENENELKLKSALQKLKAITTGIPDVICTVNTNFIVTYTNNRSFAYKNRPTIGNSLEHFFIYPYNRLLIEKIKKVFNKKYIEICDLYLKSKNSEKYIYRTRISPIISEGKALEVILIFEDISKEVVQKNIMEKWFEIFDAAGWGIVTSLPNGINFDLVNPKFAEMHGYTIDEIKKIPIKNFFSKSERRKLLNTTPESSKYVHDAWESTHIRKDGSRFPVLIDATVIKDKNDILSYQAISVQDITFLKNVERKLYHERASFETTIQSIGDGIISTDRNGNIILINPIAEKITGWSKSEAIGQKVDLVFKIISEDSREYIDNPAINCMKENRTIILENDAILIKKDKSELPIEDSAAPIKNIDNETIGAIIVFRDYSERRDKIMKIEYLNFHDQLTGLYNRRYFDDALAKMNEKKKMPVSIIIIDVNGLKLTNDAFGHTAGDKLLQVVANTIKKICRINDVIARIGGDEFVLLLPRTNNDAVIHLSKRIYAEFEHVSLDNIIISVSCGFATKTQETENIGDILVKAEEMMYHKKITESQSMRNDTVKFIINTLNETNERERIHSERVSKLAKRIALMLHLDSENIKNIETAGLLHDIGKIAINKDILYKPDKLTADEYKEIQRHLEIGYQIIRSVHAYTNLADCILSHHEAWDGSGYPRGLKGEQISLSARIITIADAYEAMTSDRPYRRALSKKVAIAELKRCAGKQFDPKLIDACAKTDWKVLTEI